MSEHIETTCDACGQTDDHPMVHLAYAVWEKDATHFVVEPSFHFDCLPAQYRVGLDDDPRHAVTAAAIKAAESGTHGDALREFIQSQPDDNSIEV